MTAAVWDGYGGMSHVRMVRDIAAVLDPSIEGYLFPPLSKPNEMANMWRELGFAGVEQTSLLIRMEFSCFDDYWQPFTTGEGPPGRLIASLHESKRAALADHMRRAYVANRPDGPRSFACVAWAWSVHAWSDCNWRMMSAFSKWSGTIARSGRLYRPGASTAAAVRSFWPTIGAISKMLVSMSISCRATVRPTSSIA